MSTWFTGWKFWPDRPQGPVGASYRQVKWIRPYRPGPMRWLVTCLGLIITALPTMLAMGALLWLATRFLPALASGAHSLEQAVALFIVIGAGIAIYGLFLRLFGVTGWREAVNAVRQSGPS